MTEETDRERLVRIETKLDAYLATGVTTVADHETRLRTMERGMGRVLAFVALGSSLVGGAAAATGTYVMHRVLPP